MYNFHRRILHAATHRLRLLARAEDGFTIIEVVMSAVLVVLIAGGVMTGIDAAGRSSADLRHRSQAQELANQDQERMRGMSSLQLASLDETRPVTVDGTNYQVHSTGQFLTHSGGGTSCGGQSAADYIKVVSTVDWPPLNRRPPVVAQSIITPPIGGTMLIRVPDENGNGVPGAALTVDGPERFSLTTGSDGCAILPAVQTGDYTITASKAGYIDHDGNSSVTAQARATTSDTAIPQLDALGQAGAIDARFSTQVGTTTYTNQRAPALSWYNLDAYNGVSQNRTATAANGSASILTHPTNLTLFPFAVAGNYTNNWTVWGGRCIDAKPPSNLSFATVNPGSTAVLSNVGSAVNPPIKLPALIINVSYKTWTSTTRVTPSHIELTDACNQTWSPEVRPGDPMSPLGQLNYPGQPFAPSTDRYIVCADYDPDGTGPASSYRTSPFSFAFPRTANDNFTQGTTMNVTIDSTSGWNVGTC